MRKQELYIFIAVIILVIFIFISYAIFSLFSRPSSPQPSPSPIPTPVRSPQPSRILDISPGPIATPTPSPSASVSPSLTKEQLLDTLPIRTPLFNIEHYTKDDLFRITIKENPYQENQNLAQQWFRDRGIDPSGLNIYWDAFPNVTR